ncbi:OmpA family protein [Limimaricola cinnabarinus]|uniref:OmpA family protein n=1 Tax=Limimaricola cinnabarinus TaxID=1125964 RepID=UPI002FDF58E8
MIRAAALAVLWPGMGLAFELPLPEGAQRTAERRAEAADHALPTGPAQGAPPPVEAIEGLVETRAWRIPAPAPPLAGLIAPMRAALRAAGFEILLDCAARACGGYEFRYGIEVLPPPEMHVDLGAFRYLSARRDGPEGPSAVGILASRAGETGHLQVTTVTPAGTPDIAPQVAPRMAPADLAAALDREGHAVLEGISFAPGAAVLEETAPAPLAALADWLAEAPSRRLVLVGHTDMTGALEANIALSRRRAEAVRDRLLRDHGVAAARVEARGAGWLAPRATNATPEGRAANRRVEALAAEG